MAQATTRGSNSPRVTTTAFPSIPLACYAVGERVLYFFDNAQYGVEATVVQGYGFKIVPSPNGVEIMPDGVRVDYHDGYYIELDGRQYFAPSSRLTDLACKPRHIRLVPKRVTQ